MIFRTVAKYFIDSIGGDVKNFDKVKQEAIEDAYRNLFADNPNGDIVLHDIAMFVGLDKVNYSNDFKPETLAFLEGQRSVFLRILQMVELTELKFISKRRKEQQKDG